MNSETRKKARWIMDAGLFGGFLIACLLDLTGVALHQWLGVAVGALALYHMIEHWDWVAAVTRRLFGRAGSSARRFWLLDAGILAGFSAIGISGLVISTWANLSLANYATWRAAHVLASVATLGLIVAKVGLHWRWVAAGLWKPSPDGVTAERPVRPGQLQPVPVRTGRREFLKLMGVVGAAAALAGASALSGADGARAQALAATPATPGSAAQTNATSSCAIRCAKGCSSPGRCRRYVDSNRNGRCDLGECIASS